MATITEVAPDLFRLSIHDCNANLQFNHFLVRDEEPLLFHAGYRGMFPELREALERLIRPSELRWIGFSHFESDECGALNEWLELAPRAQAVCSQVGAVVMVEDFAIRPPRGLTQGEVLNTGCHRFRFCSTPHLPHAWDNGILFEETARTLLCSDLFFHDGAVEPVTEADVVGRTRQTSTRDQSGPLANSVAYTPQTTAILEGLAELRPRTLALMHGSTFVGDGARALRELDRVLEELFGQPR